LYLSFAMEIYKTRRFTSVDWASNSNIYEVNIRQYTKEGSFRAFATHMPRLRSMGVEILWFMPITPISHLERLGSLGSYYACSDYQSTNPEFGTIADFQWLVEYAHVLGFKVLIDWVANHTGWDHVWTKEHPEFYRRNPEGLFYDAHGWRDVIDLNYDVPELRTAMIQAMKFWVDTCHIDGFRCDMAMLVPLDFWKEARTELDKIKPLFWLAECEDIPYHEVFDITYTWKWLHTMEAYWRHTAGMHGLYETLGFYRTQFPPNVKRAYFTSNHDENSHSGSEYERLGEAAIPFAVFCCLYDGLPLIYSGQELPNKKRLLFFDKDEINWSEHIQLYGFYRTLLNLRKTNLALRGGNEQNAPQLLSNTATDKVLSFQRKYENDEVIVILNLSHEQISLEITSGHLADYYNDVFNPGDSPFLHGQSVPLNPWAFKVFVK
jgi:alpha-amylase